MYTHSMAKPEYDIVEFPSAAKCGQWFEKHQADTDGIWARLYKKDSGVTSLSHAEVLDVALCYGWIDGQAKKLDDASWLQKFTPRRAKSMWSQRNIEHVQRLIKEKKMKPAGLAEIERAKKDGRWDRAYASPANMQVPDDFLKSLAKDKEAKAFFETLNKANTYAIAWRLNTAKKPETRDKRMHVILKMMKEGKRFH